METKTILSEKFGLQGRDFVKGLIMAVLTAVITFAYEIVQQDWDFEDVNYATVGKVALTAAVGYIFKNWAIEPAKVITVAGSNRDAKVAETMISDKLSQ